MASHWVAISGNTSLIATFPGIKVKPECNNLQLNGMSYRGAQTMQMPPVIGNRTQIQSEQQLSSNRQFSY